MRTDLRKWLAIGTGVGIEIGAEELRVVVVRVRPNGAQVLGVKTIPQFRARPAAEWGAEYAAFLKSLGAAYLAATVLLPRSELIVRQLALPGVEDRDLAGAVRYQIDALHPYAEDEAAWDFTRVGRTSSILIGITRRALVERYAELFAQAGIKVCSFTFSAVVVHSAIRLFREPAPEGFVALVERLGEVEVYGESPSHPVFSAIFDALPERAAALAASELRLGAEAEPGPLERLLPAPARAPAEFSFALLGLPYATALAGACPRLSLGVNLLPAPQRSSSSRAMFIPSAVLASVLLILCGTLLVESLMADRRYLAAIQSEIARLEPQANKTVNADRAIEAIRRRAILLDEFRRRSKADLDALQELTRVLAPPVWLNSLELSREAVTVGGEADQAAGLLKLLDESRAFRDSQFTSPIARVGTSEVFRIRSAREGGAE